MLGRRFFEGEEEVEGDDVEALAMRVGRRHRVKTPINRQRRPDTWGKVMAREVGSIKGVIHGPNNVI